MLRRLDVKIILTLLFTAMVPLGISIYLVSKAVDISLGVGLNATISEHMEQSLEIHRSYIEEIKKGHTSLINHLVDSVVLKEAAENINEHLLEKALEDHLSANPSVLEIRLTGINDRTISVIAAASPTLMPYRKIKRTKKISIGPYTLIDVTFKVDQSITNNYEQAGRDMGTYQTMVSAPPYYLSRRVILVYLALLGGVFFLSITGGVFWTKRLARRIRSLSEATSSVASGNLNVWVDPGSFDEVGVLVNSFNGMVSELSDSRARIEYLQKISAWQEMARRLAHEIKNPLTPIYLASQQLREKWSGEDSAFGRLLEQSTEIIDEEVATLRRLTADFSSFARLPQIKPELLDLQDFLRDCEVSLKHLAVAGDLSIDFEIPKEKISVFLDSIMMKRVIDNLTRNAAEALQNTEVKNPSIKISVIKQKKKTTEIEIRVKDNGPGILPEHHSSIFDPYYTTKIEGTGLGLAISKKVVLDHGGSIWVDKNTVEGATFVIVIPTRSNKADRFL